MIKHDFNKIKPKHKLSSFRYASLRKSINQQINQLSLSAIQSNFNTPPRKNQQTKPSKNIINNKSVIVPKYERPSTDGNHQTSVMKQKIKENIIAMLRDNRKNRVYIVKQNHQSFENYVNQEKINILQKSYRQFFDTDLYIEAPKIKTPSKIAIQSSSFKKNTHNFMSSLIEPCHIKTLKLLNRPQTAKSLMKSTNKINKNSGKEKGNDQILDQKYNNRRYATANSKRRNSIIGLNNINRKQNEQIRGWDMKDEETIIY